VALNYLSKKRSMKNIAGAQRAYNINGKAFGVN
jgi:hypothetical protein